jgi:hypothetical protein
MTLQFMSTRRPNNKLAMAILAGIVSRPVVGVLKENSCIGCVCTSKEGRRSGELETKIQGVEIRGLRPLIGLVSPGTEP